MTIKLNSIASAPWNPRADITPESVTELAADIEKNGLIQPIRIWKDADGQWLCIAGNRRLAALHALHTNDYDGELPADHYIVFGGTEDEARALTFRENHHRINLTPLGEAAQIAQFIADGMTVEDAALALGISVKTARRRSRLNDLADAWKRDDLGIEVLEKIATYPTDVQERVAKNLWSGARSWRDIGPRFDDATKDLDAARFDTAPCATCLKRTGVEADLFGIADGKLGRCLDCKCFAEKKDAHDKVEIAKLTKGAGEVVRCEYEWKLPDEEDSSSKKTKSHPCAYVAQNAGGEWVVRWAESKAAKEAREEAEKEARRVEYEANARERERINGIIEKLEAATYNADEDGRAKVEEVIAATISNADENITAWLVELAANDVCGWNGPQSYAHLVRIIPELATLAGLTDADREYLLDEYPETDDGEDGEEE